MARMQAVYYRDRLGVEPVRDFRDRLPDSAQAVMILQIGRLNRADPDDPPPAFPYTSQVEGELRELRCHYGRRLYRILYRRSEHLFLLLHAFQKQSRRVPEAEKAVARKRWADFKARMDEDPRRPPRPIGHDAP